jgi:hypothetical protein
MQKIIYKQSYINLDIKFFQKYKMNIREIEKIYFIKHSKISFEFECVNILN